MKNTSTGLIVMAIVLIFLSCDNDPLEPEGNNSTKVTVKFEIPAREILENGSPQMVFVKLDKPAPNDFNLVITPGNHFGQNLSSVPSIENGLINVPIVKGQTSASLKLIPLDNTQQDGHRVIELKIDPLQNPFIAGTLSTLKVTIKDNETTPALESLANFIPRNLTLDETHTTWMEYQVHFSEAVANDSEIKITFSSEKGVHGVDYTSQPLAVDNAISLPVSAGSRVISFFVRPLNNANITGELKIRMTISETSAPIKKGHILEETLIVRDDELKGKPRGYEVTAGQEIQKKFYEYNADGRISKVDWETYTSFYRRGTDTYYYTENGQLERINKAPGRDVLYHWENGQIVKSDDIREGVMVYYHEYDYDDAGHIQGVVTYYREDDGSFTKGPFTVYLYHTDGNLYKSLSYQENHNPGEEPYLLSTRTYENYIDGVNLFPMTEVLPTIAMQTKLATIYRVQESGLDQTYHLTYEFRPDGLPEKRIATSPGSMQTAVYHYY